MSKVLQRLRDAIISPNFSPLTWLYLDTSSSLSHLQFSTPFLTPPREGPVHTLPLLESIPGSLPLCLVGVVLSCFHDSPSTSLLFFHGSLPFCPEFDHGELYIPLSLNVLLAATPWHWQDTPVSILLLEQHKIVNHMLKLSVFL